MQTQCPNCRGYKTHKMASYFLDPITRKRRRLNTPLGCLIPVVITLVGGPIFGGLLSQILSPLAEGNPAVLSEMFEGGIGIAFGLALIVWLVAITLRRAKLTRTALRVHYYECDICGKQFAK